MTELAKRIARIERSAANIQLVAMKRAEGEMKLRVFANSQATDGSSLGQYKSDGHVKKRQDLGRQTARKDLVLFGDLQRSIVTGNQGGKAVLGFTTNKQRTIAEGQERQIGKDVFSLSEDTIDLVFDTAWGEVQNLLGNAR
ncbi:MAG: hypothetical protein ACWA44_02470 [Thiotrichales bacterium]